jgi:hypothetical protein
MILSKPHSFVKIMHRYNRPIRKGKAVPLHAMEALGGEEV